MENINCNKCMNLSYNKYTCILECKKLNCSCHREESNFKFTTGGVEPRIIPDVAESLCPGMVKYTVK